MSALLIGETVSQTNQIKCWFLRRGENRSTRRKTSRSKVENQQTQPTYDAGSWNRTRDTLVEGERCHHCANPAPSTLLTLLAEPIVTYNYLHYNYTVLTLRRKEYFSMNHPITEKFSRSYLMSSLLIKS